MLRHSGITAKKKTAAAQSIRASDARPTASATIPTCPISVERRNPYQAISFQGHQAGSWLRESSGLDDAFRGAEIGARAIVDADAVA